MSKCKRNIILIFGYLLIFAVLFIPYKLEKVVWNGRKESEKFWNYKESLTEKQREQLEEYSQTWSNYAFSKFELKMTDEEIGIPSEQLMLPPGFPHPPIPESIEIHKRGLIFLPWFIRGKINQTKKDKAFNSIGYIFRVDWLEAYQKGFSEFGNISKVISYEINLDFFIPEIIFVLLLGGFAYILFCVVSKKSEKRRDK